jgi:hypothetical protein
VDVVEEGNPRTGEPSCSISEVEGLSRKGLSEAIKPDGKTKGEFIMENVITGNKGVWHA